MSYLLKDLREEHRYECGDCGAVMPYRELYDHNDEYLSSDDYGSCICPLCGGFIDYEYNSDGEMQ